LLLDDDGARSRMVASWIRQLGYPNVAVLGPHTSIAMNETSEPVARPEPDDPYYPVPGSELERMQGKRRYMDWQSTLPDELESDGLVTLQPLRV
jgi:hypothetical protein